MTRRGGRGGGRAAAWQAHIEHLRLADLIGIDYPSPVVHKFWQMHRDTFRTVDAEMRTIAAALTRLDLVPQTLDEYRNLSLAAIAAWRGVAELLGWADPHTQFAIPDFQAHLDTMRRANAYIADNHPDLIKAINTVAQRTATSAESVA